MSSSLDDNVAYVDADAKFNTLSLWHVSIALDHAALNFDSTPYCIHYACEFDQQPVARGLYDPSTVFGDLRVDERKPMGLEFG